MGDSRDSIGAFASSVRPSAGVTTSATSMDTTTTSE